jgi:hypothetical protein
MRGLDIIDCDHGVSGIQDGIREQSIFSHNTFIAFLDPKFTMFVVFKDDPKFVTRMGFVNCR